MSKASRKYKADCKEYNILQFDLPFLFKRKSQSLHGYRACLHDNEMYLKREKKENE